ncbi:MAG: cytochrome c, partial [Sphingobacteriales bacterium]
MKKIAIILLALFACSCNEDGSPINAFLNTDKLESQQYEIDLQRDTVLLTKGGARITIASGAIVAGNKQKVKLEVKEAYTMEDMVRGGLLTKSGDRMLSSGGMIYLNVADGKVQSPLAVSMPSGNLESAMQLFKGETQKDGSIDWRDPQAMQLNKTLDSIAQGKNIFQTNCASCHAVSSESTGPPLAFAPQRLGRDWMDHFIENSAEMIAYGDSYANCIYNRWGKTAMTAFPNLTRAELDMLYNYLDQESKHLNPADYPDTKAEFDSCNAYMQAKAELERRRVKAVEGNGFETNRMWDFDSVITATEFDDTLWVPAIKKVIPKTDLSTYYNFTINSFGWYNVDAFVTNVPGNVASTVKARLRGAYTGPVNIFLIIPDSRLLADGGLLHGETSTYGFYEDNGSILLPQGKQAYIICFTENDKGVYYGMSSFTTTTK